MGFCLPEQMNSKKQVLREARNYLEFQKNMGVTAVPRKKIVQQPAGAKNVSPLLGLQEKKAALHMLQQSMHDCTRCRLHEKATQLVFGVGNSAATLMFVGEAPGRDEDAKGEPFVGRAGKLLDKIIEAMGMKREDVYIGNVAKHRPPENRQPAADEMATCLPFLREQINIIQPKIIVTLGATAIQGLLATEEKISQLRGKWINWDGIWVMPTYHPAFLLRNPAMKKPVWEDMQKVMEKMKEMA